MKPDLPAIRKRIAEATKLASGLDIKRVAVPRTDVEELVAEVERLKGVDQDLSVLRMSHDEKVRLLEDLAPALLSDPDLWDSMKRERDEARTRVVELELECDSLAAMASTDEVANENGKLERERDEALAQIRARDITNAKLAEALADTRWRAEQAEAKLAEYRERVHGGEECPGGSECVVCRGEAATCIAAHNEARAELDARVAELEAGGCSRDQGTTQFCQEAVAAVARAEEAEAEVAASNELFEQQLHRDLEALQLWREAHPEEELVVPDRAYMTGWLLDSMFYAMQRALRSESNGAKLREAAEALVAAFTDNGRLDDYWAEMRKPCPTQGEGEYCPWHEDHGRVAKFDAAVALLKETSDEA